jgi:hypothetical protein
MRQGELVDGLSVWLATRCCCKNLTQRDRKSWATRCVHQQSVFKTTNDGMQSNCVKRQCSTPASRPYQYDKV